VKCSETNIQSETCSMSHGTLQFSGSLRVNDALHPSKSGLKHHHIVKHFRVHIRCPVPVQVRTHTQAYCEANVHINHHNTAPAAPPQLTSSLDRPQATFDTARTCPCHHATGIPISDKPELCDLGCVMWVTFACACTLPVPVVQVQTVQR